MLFWSNYIQGKYFLEGRRHYAIYSWFDSKNSVIFERIFWMTGNWNEQGKLGSSRSSEETGVQNLHTVCAGSHSQSVLPKIFGSWNYLTIFIGLLVQIPGLSVVQELKNFEFDSNSLVRAACKKLLLSYTLLFAVNIKMIKRLVK